MDTQTLSNLNEFEFRRVQGGPIYDMALPEIFQVFVEVP